MTRTEIVLAVALITAAIAAALYGGGWKINDCARNPGEVCRMQGR